MFKFSKIKSAPFCSASWLLAASLVSGTSLISGSALISGTALAQEAEEPANDAAAAMAGGMTEESNLDDERARTHFRTGQSLYEAGRFDLAAEEFEEAARLSQRPELYYNAYIAYRDGNNLEGAAQSLSAYLERAENIEDRVNLEARLASMREALTERETDAEALAQAERDREAALSMPAPVAEPPLWPWIVAGTGAAIAAGGAVVGGLALSEAGSLVGSCDVDGFCSPDIDLDTRQSDVQTLGLVADIMLFGGGALAVTGVVLAFVLPSGQDDPQVSASCGPTFCGANLRASF